MICSLCGAETPEGSALCSSCGKGLTSSSSPTSPARLARSPAPTPAFSFAPGQSFGQRYTVVEEIGVGGMGCVYKAIDRELNRTIALKLVPPDVAARSGALERFKRELALAQQVAHPNVCRVHDLGEVEGIRYISMEYIDGQTLRDWIQAVGHLSPRQTIALGRQICAGLGAIHERSIVHRDLKPSNIMVDRSGRAVVMDFGLAYHRESDKITGVGEVLGTLAYLSPEQARGASIDPRSDIYSLGLVLFEMLTGRRPPGDEGRLPLALRDSEEQCPPPSRFAPEVPANLDVLVLRCLERESAKRFPSVTELDRALAEASGSLSPAPAPARRLARPRVRALAALGAAIALTLGAVIMGLLSGRPPTPSGPVAIALLPLAYEGPRERAYLGLLLPLLLGDELRASPDLRLAPFASSRSFAPREDSLSVGRQLGVNWVLQGELRVREERFEVTLRLRDLEDNREAWSRKIDGEPENLFAVAQTVAGDLAAALGTNLGASSTSGLARSHRALQHYLEGKRLLEGWDVESNHTRAAEAFERAIEEEDSFAEAHAGLALALWTRYEETNELGLVERALAEARRATSLGPSVPEAQVALGVVQLGRGRSAEAAASFQKAQELAPADDAVCRRIADAYADLGREEDAERMYQRAIDLRPGYWEHYNRKGVFHLDHGKLERAKELFREVIRFRPESDTGYGNLAVTHILAGEFPEAEPLLQAAIRMNPAGAQVHNNLGVVYYSMGRFEAAAREFRLAIDAGVERVMPWGNLGDAFRQLGRSEEAREAYVRAIELAEARLRVNPTDVELRAFLSMSLAGYGRCDRARQEAAQATVEATENPTVHYYAAVAFAICGDREAAIRHTARAIKGGVVVDVRTNPDLQPFLNDARVLLR